MDHVETTVVSSTATADSFSLISMFLGADLVVQMVMLLLIAASFWSWTIIFSKWLQIRRTLRAADYFEDNFWSSKSLDDLYDRINRNSDDPMSMIFISAMNELRRTMVKGRALEGLLSVRDRLEKVMHVVVGREIDQFEQHLGFLATVGSTAPFVGLFGTVWGVMHSFQGIAAAKSTNLAVVAPGIAEALFATALGLVVAIPAVVAYNRFSAEITRYANRLDTFVQEFSSIISRQLEDA